MPDKYRLLINGEIVVTKNSYDDILNAYVRRSKRLETKILEHNDIGACITLEIRELFYDKPILAKTIRGKDVLYGR